jgi:protein-glutamine gamma-glutamyltransferase
MSSVQVAVLPGGAGPPAVAQASSAGRPERIGVQGAAFAALGLYGVARWDTLLAGGLGRLLGLLILSTVLAIGGPLLAGLRRWLAGLAFVLAALAGLAISGLPIEWVIHLRVAVSGQAIGNGLSALPQISVPYVGINQWVRVTLLLGAMILLLDAALVLTFVPRRLGLLRRAGAALPLMALSVIPATALRPLSSYLEGVLLFGLVVLFVWGERIHSRRLAAVLGPCALAAALGVGLAPSLDHHRAWINYRQLAASLAPGGVETFNWTQGYGPLLWPHAGRAVMEIQAAHPEYWKAENLDVFDGQGWVASPAQVDVPWQTDVSPSSLRRWTEPIQVTVDSMATNNVIAAGSAYPPSAVPGGAVSGVSPGTWQSNRRLRPGASYRVLVYAPDPPPAQLASAGSGYPAAVQRAYLSLTLPDLAGLSPAEAASYPAAGLPEKVVFPPFGTGLSPDGFTGTTLAASPYRRAFSLAQRLRAGAANPYQYVRRVETYLSHGYRYSQTPASSTFPLETFLFKTRLGYCQHFAGAMALLLRMGGVPARVAVGFTSGVYDGTTRRWVVSDLGAHAWVEVWFPHYGWVRFDPTPAADPALSENLATSAAGPASEPTHRASNNGHGFGRTSGPVRHPSLGRASAGSAVWPVVGGPALALVLVVLLLLTRARPGQDPIGELTQAYARTGRPLDSTTTLSRLEARLAHAPDAAAYVRALRLARFRSDPPAAGVRGLLHGRRALRKALGRGLGPIGRARTWWGLPPRWKWPRGE